MTLMRPLKHSRAFLGGQWVSSEQTFVVTDPSTGGGLGTVPDFGAEAVRICVDAADAALENWAGRTAMERGKVLRRWANLILEHAGDLASLMTSEQGKPLSEARAEIVYAAGFIDWFAEEAKRAYGRVIPSPFADRRLMTVQKPVGVVAAITPWNFPVAMITRKLGPALAAGCTAIVKPSDLTPFSALALADLAQRAGIPAGVLSVVTGQDAKGIGRALCDDPRVRKLSFTGSTAVGKQLYAQCAETMKRLSLELGGNAPFIVFDDADLEAAVAGAIASKFRNAGQTCVCANRFYVQSGIYDAFVARLTEAVAELKVGPGHQAGVQIGPLISPTAVQKVTELVAGAMADGARCLTGGQVLEGQFYAPTVLVDVRADSAITHTEIFGPVVAIQRFEAEDAAIALANSIPTGLAAYAYTRDPARMVRLTEGLQTGMLGLNTGLISTEVAPFGGVKESGLGREGGAEGLLEYLDTTYVCTGL